MGIILIYTAGQIAHLNPGSHILVQHPTCLAQTIGLDQLSDNALNQVDIIALNHQIRRDEIPAAELLARFTVLCT